MLRDFDAKWVKFEQAYIRTVHAIVTVVNAGENDDDDIVVVLMSEGVVRAAPNVLWSRAPPGCSSARPGAL